MNPGTGHGGLGLGGGIVTLLEELIPGTIALHLGPLLDEFFVKPLKEIRDPLHSLGRFVPGAAASILREIAQDQRSGALVIVCGDAQKVLLFEGGSVVAAKSTVVFEQVGRLAVREELVDEEQAEVLFDAEQIIGLGEALRQVGDAADGLSERLILKIGCSLYFMGHGYWIFVDGEPAVERLPKVRVDAQMLALEGLRQYDEWRHGSQSADASSGDDPAP